MIIIIESYRKFAYFIPSSLLLLELNIKDKWLIAKQIVYLTVTTYIFYLNATLTRMYCNIIMRNRTVFRHFIVTLNLLQLDEKIKETVLCVLYRRKHAFILYLNAVPLFSYGCCTK